MTNRQSGDLSDLPRMVPDKDDIASRRGGPGAPPSGPGGGAPGPSGPVKRPALWPLYFLFLILAAALGYGGYELWQSQQQLASAESDLQSASDRIESLESQLSATDESLTMNESAIQSNFNNILSEIRRLWDVADSRNLDWIRENQSAIGDLFSEVESLADQFTALEGDMASASEQRADITEDMNAMHNENEDLRTDIRTLQQQEEELIARLDIVTMRVEGTVEVTTSMNQQLNDLDQSLQQLAQRLNQEAETRSDLSESLSQLRNRVNALEDGAGGTAFDDLAGRVDAIDAARADNIQRLSTIQSQLGDIRRRLEDAEAQLQGGN